MVNKKVISQQFHWFFPALAACLCWGLWAFLPKMALQSMSPVNVFFFEGCGGMVVGFVILLQLKGSLKKDATGLRWTALQVIFVVAATIAYFYALKTGPIAVVTTMTAMYPVVSFILARVLFKEKVNRTQLLAIFLAMTAIYLLAG